VPESLAPVFARIDARVDELVALTQDLVRFPTINPPGEAYRPCAEYLGARLARRGFAVEYLRGTGAPGDSERYPRTNVIARYEAGRPGPCLHFNGHIDVVEPGRGWTVEPFAGVVREGRVYGRGTCDMKGGLAAAIVAVESLLEAGTPLQGAIEISGTVDEESGGYGGVAYLAERGYFAPSRVNHVIIPEPLNVDRVCIGHRGVWWAEIETQGRIAHGSMPFLGDCAVRHMGAVLEGFERELWPVLAARRTVMPVVPAGARQSTLNVNSLHGGQAERPSDSAGGLPSPVVPDSCRMVIDRRFLIEESLADVKGEVRALLDRLVATRAGFRYSLRDLFEVLPTMADPAGPVVQATVAAVSEILGRAPEIVCSPGTYDQKHIDRIGRLKDCIAYGPGVLDLAHRPDEYVGIADMVSAAKVMARATQALLGRRD
jgi:succinyl-diaminopimelate desuccinylase